MGVSRRLSLLSLLLLLAVVTITAQDGVSYLAIYTTEVGRDAPNSFVPSASNIVAEQYYGGQSGSLSVDLNAAAATTRVYLFLNYSSTLAGTPLQFVERVSNLNITNNTLFELPYQLQTASNNIYLDAFGINIVVSITKQGWITGLSSGFSYIVPGQPQTVTFTPLSSIQLDMAFTLSVTSGTLNVNTINMTGGSQPTASVVFTPDWTASHAQTVLLTATPTILQAVDRRWLGEIQPVQLQVVPNGICGSDDGHLVFDAAGSGYASFSMSAVTRSFTTCFWRKPIITSTATQVWIAIGGSSDSYQMGVYGGAEGPVGGIFQRDPVTGQTVSFSPSPNNYDSNMWQHVCHVYGSSVDFAGQSIVQTFVSGVPVTAPVPTTTDWTTSSTAVTIGSSYDHTYAATGALDEFRLFLTVLNPLQIYYGFQTNNWYRGSTYYYFPFSEQASNYFMDHGDYFSSSLYVYSSGGNFMYSQADPVCTSISPQAGSLGMQSITGTGCVQPFRFSSLTNSGQNNDGQLAVASDSSTTTGGGTWSGTPSTPLTLTLVDFTICTWVKRSQNAGAGVSQTLYSVGNPFASYSTLSFSYRDSNIVVSFAGRADDSVIPLTARIDGATSTNDVGQWIHWCLVMTATNADSPGVPPHRTLYRNGAWFSEVYLTAGDFQSSSAVASNNNIYLGSAPFGANVLMGYLDEWRFMADARTQDQITDYYYNDNFPTALGDGLLLYFRFNDAGVKGSTTVTSTVDNQGPTVTAVLNVMNGSSANSFTDGTAYTCVTLNPAFNDADLVYTNGAPYAGDVFHPFGLSNTQSINLGGKAGTTLKLASHSYSFASSDFSFCFWVKRASNLYSSIGEISYDLSIGSTASDMWTGAYVNTMTGEVNYAFSIGGKALNAPLISSPSSDSGRWQHVCGTYASIAKNGASSAIRKLYLNGELVGEDTPTIDLSVNQPIWLGQRGDGILGFVSDARNYDELMFWTRTISTTEIRQYIAKQTVTSPVMSFPFSGTGASSVSATDVLACIATGSTVCSYSNDRVAFQLAAPMVCPVGRYTDGQLMQAGYDGNSTAVNGRTLKTSSGLKVANSDITIGFWVYRSDISYDSRVFTISGGADSMHFTLPSSTTTLVTNYGLPYISINGLNFTYTNPNGGTIPSSTASFKPKGRMMKAVIGGAQIIVDRYSWVYHTVTYQSYATSQQSSLSYYRNSMYQEGTYANNNYDLTSSALQLFLFGDAVSSISSNIVLDEFRLYKRLLSINELTMLSNGNEYWSQVPPNINAGLTNGLLVQYTFADQTGNSATSTHSLSPVAPAVSSINTASCSAEPFWNAPGLTTYFDSGYSDPTRPTMPTAIPSSAGIVNCLQSNINGYPLFTYSTDLDHMDYKLPVGFTATVYVVWLQTVGPLGLDLHITTPQVSTITATPSVLQYTRGGGGMTASMTSPKSFVITASAAQFATIAFYPVGPEAVHVSTAVVPTMTFKVYNDVQSLQVVCVHSDIASSTYTAVALSPAFVSGAVTSLPVATFDSTMYNTCKIRVTRFNNDNTLLGPLTFTAGSSVSSLQAADGSSSWTVIESQPFYVSIGVNQYSLKSKAEGTYQFSFNRVQVGAQSLSITAPTSMAQGSSGTLVLSTTVSLAPVTITVTPVGVTVPLSQSTFTIAPKATVNSVSISFTYPVLHPAWPQLSFIITLSGHGADEVSYFSPGAISISNTFLTQGVDIVTASFQSTVSGAMFNVCTLVSSDPLLNTFYMTLPSSLYASNMALTLYLDTPMSKVEYYYRNSSYAALSLLTAVDLILPLDFLLGSRTIASSGSTQSYPYQASLSIGGFSSGTSIIFVRTTNGAGSSTKLFRLIVTVQSDIQSIAAVCTSSVSSLGSFAITKTFPLSLTNLGANNAMVSLNSANNSPAYSSTGASSSNSTNSTNSSGRRLLQTGANIPLNVTGSTLASSVSSVSSVASGVVNDGFYITPGIPVSSPDQINTGLYDRCTLQVTVGGFDYASMGLFPPSSASFIYNSFYTIVPTQLGLGPVIFQQSQSFYYVSGNSSSLQFQSSQFPVPATGGQTVNLLSHDAYNIIMMTSDYAQLSPYYARSTAISSAIVTTSKVDGFNSNIQTSSVSISDAFQEYTVPLAGDVKSMNFMPTFFDSTMHIAVALYSGKPYNMSSMPPPSSFNPSLTQYDTTLLSLSAGATAQIWYRITTYDYTYTHYYVFNIEVSTSLSGYSAPTAIISNSFTCSNSQCMYGALCLSSTVSAVNASLTSLLTGTQTQQSTGTCVCGSVFRGPLCQFAILDCVSCVMPAPPTNSSAPPVYANLTFVGLAFDRITGVTVGNLRVDPSSFISYEKLNITSPYISSALAKRVYPVSLLTQQTGFFLLRVQVNVADVYNSISGSSSSTTTQSSTVSKFETNGVVRSSHSSHSSVMFAVSASRDISIGLDLLFSTPTSTSYNGIASQSAYSTCLNVNEWKPDPNNPSACLACPNGGWCPGGGIVYPLSGYWSTNAQSAPVACPLKDVQCPGTDDLTPFGSDGLKITTNCGAGYEGTMCSTCSTDYYQSGIQCLPCGSSTSEKAQLFGLLLLGCAVMGSLAIAVAIASSEALGKIVALFVICQQIIATGKASSEKFPDGFKQLGDLFNTLGIINFDLSFLKPGCVISTYSFIDTFYGTLLFCFISFVLFFLACWLRKQYLMLQHAALELVKDIKGTDEDEHKETNSPVQQYKRPAVSPEIERENRRIKKEGQIYVAYRRRLIHSSLIILSLFYLKMGTLQINAFHCVEVGLTSSTNAAGTTTSTATKYVLATDATLECWKGAHMVTIIISCILLVFYTLLFPLACLVVLTRAFAPAILRSEVHSKSFLGRIISCLGYHSPKHQTELDRKRSLERIATLNRPASVDAKEVHAAVEAKVASMKVKVGQDLTQIEEEARAEAEYRERHRVHMQLFGYLFRGVRDERFFFRLFAFPISLGFVFCLTFIDDSVLKTFVLGAIYAFAAGIHTLFVPFSEWRDNVIGAGANLASLIYSIGMLSLMDGQSAGIMMLVLGGCAVVFFILFVFNILLAKDTKKAVSKDNQVASIDAIGMKQLNKTPLHTLHEEEAFFTVKGKDAPKVESPKEKDEPHAEAAGQSPPPVSSPTEEADVLASPSAAVPPAFVTPETFVTDVEEHHHLAESPVAHSAEAAVESPVAAESPVPLAAASASDASPSAVESIEEPAFQPVAAIRTSQPNSRRGSLNKVHPEP